MQTKLVNYNLNLNPKVNYLLVNNSPRFSTPTLKRDVFEKRTIPKEIHFGYNLEASLRTLPKIFKEIDGVTPESFSKMSKAKVKHLSAVANNFVKKELVSDVLKATKILKDNLDKRYGAGKYVFVSIGQSPAVLAEMLSTIGVETAICPISLLSSNIAADKMLKNPDLQKYFEYLKKIGLDPEKIKISGKKYIFTDFFANGASLSNFREVLTDPKCGYDLPNVTFEPLQYLLTPNIFIKNREDEHFMEKFVSQYISNCELKNYSPIFRLPYENIHLVQEYRDKTPASKSLNMLKFLTLERIHGKNQT